MRPVTRAKFACHMTLAPAKLAALATAGHEPQQTHVQPYPGAHHSLTARRAPACVSKVGPG